MVSNMSSASARNAGVDALDRLGNEPQPLVRNFEDVPQRHSGDVSGA